MNVKVEPDCRVSLTVVDGVPYIAGQIMIFGTQCVVVGEKPLE